MNTVILWSTLQQADKLSLVQQLATMRLDLLEKARIKRAAKGRKKRTAKKTTFRSPELRAFFETMPDEMKKFVGR